MDGPGCRIEMHFRRVTETSEHAYLPGGTPIALLYTDFHGERHIHVRLLLPGTLTEPRVPPDWTQARLKAVEMYQAWQSAAHGHRVSVVPRVVTPACRPAAPVAVGVD